MSSIYQPTDVIITNTVASPGAVITGAPYYFITGISIQLTANNTLGNIYAVTISDTFSGNVYYCGNFFVPATYSSTGKIDNPATLQTPAGFFWKSKHAGSQLVVTLSTTASNGIVCIINYGIASI